MRPRAIALISVLSLTAGLPALRSGAATEPAAKPGVLLSRVCAKVLAQTLATRPDSARLRYWMGVLDLEAAVPKAAPSGAEPAGTKPTGSAAPNAASVTRCSKSG